MQETVTLKLEDRTALGTRAVRKIRRLSQVPVVVYGSGMQSTALSGSYHDIAKAYNHAGKHSPIELHIGGKKRLAMVKKVDLEPVKHKLLHMAFYAVKQNEKVQTEVAVRLAGEEDTPAQKAGLILIKNTETVQIEAFPRDLPEAIEIDGQKLVEAGDTITVADIVAPQGVTILTDGAQQLISAVEPAALAAAHDAADTDEDGAVTDDTADEPSEDASPEEVKS